MDDVVTEEIKTIIAATYDPLQILDLLEISNEELLDAFEGRLAEYLGVFNTLSSTEDDEDHD